MDLRPSLDPAPTDRHEVVREGVPSPMPADLYKTVFEASFGLSLVADGKGRIRALSDAAADLFPSRRVALGSQVQEAPWWAEPDRVAESIRLARGGLLDRFLAPIRRDGAECTLLVDVQSVDGPDGELWFLLEARDVTTLLASEAHLQDAHMALDRERAQLRAVLDATPDAIASVDAEGRVLVVNQSARDLGLDADEALFLGEPVLERGTWGAYWRRALSGETVRTRVRRAASDVRPAEWLDLAFAPVRVGGEVRGAVVAVVDVTSRIHAEEIEGAVEAGLVGTFVLDAHGHLVRSTAVLRALFGRPGARSAEDLADGLLDPEVARAAFRDVLAAPGRTLDLRVRLADNPASLWIRGTSIPSEDGSRLVGVAYDTTPIQDADAAERWADLVDAGGWGGQGTTAETVDIGVLAAPPDPAILAARLDALRRTGLLGAEPSESFEELTRLVSASLGVPVSLVSLVDEDRQVFAGRTGTDLTETPLSHSFCQHVANERRPMVVDDARTAPRLADNPAVGAMDVIAYLGVPVAAPDGHVIGALCAIDHTPHAWTEDDLRLLSSLAEAVTAEVAAHQADPSSDS